MCEWFRNQNDSLPVGILLIECVCTPNRLVKVWWKYSNGESILLYGRDDIPSNMFPSEESSIEAFYLELIGVSKNWFLRS